MEYYAHWTDISIYIALYVSSKDHQKHALNEAKQSMQLALRMESVLRGVFDTTAIRQDNMNRLYKLEHHFRYPVERLHFPSHLTQIGFLSAVLRKLRCDDGESRRNV